LSALGEARTTRQGRGVAIAAAILIFCTVRLFGIAANSFVVSRPRAEYFVWAIPFIASLLSLDAIFGGPLSRLAGRLPRRATLRR
jgi:lipopolysaccharide export system permease protein